MGYVIIDRRAYEDMVEKFEKTVNMIESLCQATSGDALLKKWLDVQDVCQILNISKRTLQTYRDNGTLPYTRISNKMFYKPEDVRMLIEKSKKQ